MQIKDRAELLQQSREFVEKGKGVGHSLAALGLLAIPKSHHDFSYPWAFAQAVPSTWNAQVSPWFKKTSNHASKPTLLSSISPFCISTQL